MQGVEISNGREDNSVLIVNDEPDQLRLMRTLLRKAGFTVLTAEDGAEGVSHPNAQLDRATDSWRAVNCLTSFSSRIDSLP